MSDDEINLLPGLFVAVSEGRSEYALELANLMLEHTTPAHAIIQTASWGNYLHRSPRHSLKELAMLASFDSTGLDLADDVLSNDVVGGEIMDMFELYQANGDFTPEADEIAARFDQRPGSSEIVKWLVRLMSTYTRSYEISKTIGRSASTAERFATDTVRAVIADTGRPQPFDPEYNDPPEDDDLA